MKHCKFEISVVIPSIGRDSIFKALDSVCAQCYKVKEIIIAYDGDEFEKFKYNVNNYISGKNKDQNEGPVFVLLNVGPFSGGNVARQTAIENATFDYIALLDDDDIWLDNHLYDYISILEIRNTQLPILFSCKARIIDNDSGQAAISVPPRIIRINESIPDYLFKVNKIVADCGFIQSSLMLFSKELALKIPFDVSMKFHQDIDWLLRLSQSSIEFEFIQSELNTVIYVSTPLSVSKKITAQQSMNWALSTFKDMRCLGDFLLTQSYNYARNNGTIIDELKVLYVSLRKAKPGRFALIRYFIKMSRIDLLFKHRIKD